jgi:cytochrome c biogenesis protein CcmG/thiol:disulfide interchange protein DsbE
LADSTLPESAGRRPFPLWIAIVPAALLAVVSSVFAIGLTRDPHRLPSMLIDRKMPAFTLGPLAEQRPALKNEDLIGRVSIVNVFGSWCVACVVEHPKLMEIAESGAIPIFGVDWRDKPGAGAAWLERYGDPYSLIGVDADSRLAIDLGVTGAPESFLVDTEGRIRYKHVGPITSEVWTETLLPLVRRLEVEGS